MAYNYEYPYTDPNRYNDDWLLNKMKELDNRLDGIVEETLALTKAYVDNRLETYQSQINSIKQDIAELSQRTDKLSAHVANEVLRLESKILDAERKAESLFIIANDRTDLQIQRNNEYIFREIEDNLLANISVINYFTGERMTIQKMFDYLASLHLENAITYNGSRDKNLTYAELIAKNISYTELVKNGGALL